MKECLEQLPLHWMAASPQSWEKATKPPWADCRTWGAPAQLHALGAVALAPWCVCTCYVLVTLGYAQAPWLRAPWWLFWAVDHIRADQCLEHSWVGCSHPAAARTRYPAAGSPIPASTTSPSMATSSRGLVQCPQAPNHGREQGCPRVTVQGRLCGCAGLAATAQLL